MELDMLSYMMGKKAGGGSGGGGGASDSDPEGLERATKVTINLPEERLSPQMGLAVNGTAKIYWGDGTTDTVTGSSKTTTVSTPHTYSTPGDYNIYVEVLSGSAAIYGQYMSTLLYAGIEDYNTLDVVYRNAVLAVRVGDNMTIGKNAFQYCQALRRVTTVSTLTTLGTNAFGDCYALTHVDTINVSTLNLGCFSGCMSLPKIIVTNSTTSMTSSMTNVTSLRTLDMTALDHVANLNTSQPFNYTPDDFQILVRSSLLEDYKAATNWSNWADKFVGV